MQPLQVSLMHGVYATSDPEVVSLNTDAGKIGLLLKNLVYRNREMCIGNKMASVWIMVT